MEWSIKGAVQGRDGGFSLIELLVALGVLTVVGATLVFAFNFNKSKGQVVYDLAQSIRGAAQRFEADTGCSPEGLSVLWEKSAAASPWSNSCGEDLSSVWNGPYMKPPGPVTWTATLPQIGPNAWVYLYTTRSGTMWIYFLLPPGVAKEAYQQCAGSSSCMMFGHFFVFYSN